MSKKNTTFNIYYFNSNFSYNNTYYFNNIIDILIILLYCSKSKIKLYTQNKIKNYQNKYKYFMQDIKY